MDKITPPSVELDDQRRCKEGWIPTYMKLTARMESPTAFHYWVALWVLSSVAERQIWMPQGFNNLYTNLYIVLIAQSARCRKSTAIGIGDAMLKKLQPEIYMLSQKITPEALIAGLHHRWWGYDEKTLVKMAIGSLCVDEISILLGTESYKSGLIHLLTGLYDCPERLVYETRMHGKEDLYMVYLSLMGGSTPEWMRTSMPAQTVTGGFIERIILVHSEDPRAPNPFPGLSPEELKIQEDLIHDLEYIRRNVYGPYELREDAVEWYKSWYAYNVAQTATDLPVGYWGRRHSTLLKIAMLEAYSSYNERTITPNVLVGAERILKLTERGMPKVLSTLGSSVTGYNAIKVLGYIKEAVEIRHYKLARRCYHFANGHELQQIIATLEGSREVMMRQDGRGLIYTYIGDEEDGEDTKRY